MGATLIQINSFTPIKFGAQDGTVAIAISINPNFIVGVRTKVQPYLTTGITEILYQFVVNNMKATVPLVVTQTAAAILTASNANVIST